MTTFQFVEPSEGQKEIMQNFRDKFDVIYQEIIKTITENRARSIALTKLEESGMWLNKAITSNC